MESLPLSFPNFPENLKAPGPGNWQAKPLQKSQRNWKESCSFFPLPYTRTESVILCPLHSDLAGWP